LKAFYDLNNISKVSKTSTHPVEIAQHLPVTRSLVFGGNALSRLWQGNVLRLIMLSSGIGSSLQVPTLDIGNNFEAFKELYLKAKVIILPG